LTSQSRIATRVCSVISNWTGLPVFCWIAVVRSCTRSTTHTSLTRSRRRSQPREKYRSVWVDIPSSLYDPARGHELCNTYLDQLEFAETVGFDGIGVNEHHANAYGLTPSPTLMAAALARRTSRAVLVVLGSSIPLYEPPIRVARNSRCSSCCRVAGSATVLDVRPEDEFNNGHLAGALNIPLAQLERRFTELPTSRSVAQLRSCAAGAIRCAGSKTGSQNRKMAGLPVS
jgi:hypothetical protein